MGLQRLRYGKTAEHRAALQRNPGAVSDRWLPWYAEADGTRHTWTAFNALDAQDAQDAAEYHLTRYAYAYASAFYAAWVAGGRQVEHQPFVSYRAGEGTPSLACR